MPVGRRRCIDYSLGSLVRAGVTEIIITTSYKAEMIVDGLEASDVSGHTLLFSFERQPMGTAGGVRKTAPFLDDTFIVMSADVLADVDLRTMVKIHRRKGAVATMALTTVENVSEYGVVALNGAGRIQRFQEKPRPEEAFSNLINAGIYVLEPEAIRRVPEETKFDFSKDLFPRLLKAGQPMYGHVLDGLWMDIGRPADLIRANKEVVEREGSTRSLDMTNISGSISGTFQAEPGAFVAEGAVIEGPVMLAEGVFVGEGARVSGSVLHPGVRVDAGARIVDSVILSDCSVGSHSVLQHSILDRGCSVGMGAHLTNTVVGHGTTIGVKAVHENQVLGDSP
jgi:mannose-1-phosphate guanylyltransferase